MHASHERVQRSRPWKAIVIRLLFVGMVGLAATGCGDADDTAVSTTQPPDPTQMSPTSGESGPALSATLRLTSSGCTYDGPTALSVDSRVEARLVNATDSDGGFVLTRISEESTYDELARYVGREAEAIERGEDSVPPPSDVGVVSVDPPQVPPTEERLREFVYAEGKYAFVCLEQTSQLPRRDLAIHISEPIVASP